MPLLLTHVMCPQVFLRRWPHLLHLAPCHLPPDWSTPPVPGWGPPGTAPTATRAAASAGSVATTTTTRSSNSSSSSSRAPRTGKALSMAATTTNSSSSSSNSSSRAGPLGARAATPAGRKAATQGVAWARPPAGRAAMCKVRAGGGGVAGALAALYLVACNGAGYQPLACPYEGVQGQRGLRVHLSWLSVPMAIWLHPQNQAATCGTTREHQHLCC
jgi:hypothetical protein